ncbi:MAG: EF-P beta-lysylation protein EpmB [Pirellulales bacterium]|nr:EF-P beta-lysylation protein EpmB [Pirellulales bacterium]
MDIVTAPSRNVATASDEFEEPCWQQAVRNAVRSPQELCEVLRLPDTFRRAAERAATDFKLFVPREYVEKIPVAQPDHPLLKQILPVAEEITEEGDEASIESSPSDYSRDPVGDSLALAAPGLLHKYASRVLLTLTGACAVHCRYCFRRFYPYDALPHGHAEWQPALEYIAKDTTIDEVILSGGDPWMLVDATLRRLTEQISKISHVQRLRIHTRLPIMIPARVNDSLIRWLTGTRLVPFVVVHANHPLEIDASVSAALTKLVSAGVVVLNQAVLLQGVNDSADALEALSRRLVDLRVLPYYLHQLDRVVGSQHFEVSDSKAREILTELRRRLPGYAVPRLVRENAGGEYKEIVF